jgi:hypothetical protein
MPLINTRYCELQPAYGRDYKNKKECEAAFRAGQDFLGDYQLGFKPCVIGDFEKGVPILLRYKGNRLVTQVTT